MCYVMVFGKTKRAPIFPLCRGEGALGCRVTGITLASLGAFQRGNPFPNRHTNWYGLDLVSRRGGSVLVRLRRSPKHVRNRGSWPLMLLAASSGLRPFCL